MGPVLVKGESAGQVFSNTRMCACGGTVCIYSNAVSLDLLSSRPSNLIRGEVGGFLQVVSFDLRALLGVRV